MLFEYKYVIIVLVHFFELLVHVRDRVTRVESGEYKRDAPIPHIWKNLIT